MKIKVLACVPRQEGEGSNSNAQKRRVVIKTRHKTKGVFGYLTSGGVIVIISIIGYVPVSIYCLFWLLLLLQFLLSLS